MGIDLQQHVQWDLSIMVVMGPVFIDNIIQATLSRIRTTGTRRSGHDKEDAAINSGH